MDGTQHLRGAGRKGEEEATVGKPGKGGLVGLAVRSVLEHADTLDFKVKRRRSRAWAPNSKIHLVLTRFRSGRILYLSNLLNENLGRQLVSPAHTYLGEENTKDPERKARVWSAQMGDCCWDSLMCKW